MVFEAGADVVGAEDGGFGCGLQAFGAHHADVHPADGQHGSIAQGRGADGTHAALHAAGVMAGQEGNQVFHHADGADAGAATAVGDAEGFVQVQVAHVAAELAGGGHADQGVHVGAVHVHAAAVAVHQGA